MNCRRINHPHLFAGLPGRAGGYTLIEVLVAVVVFAILAASAYVALDALSRAAVRHGERSQAFAALQLAVVRLDQDLRQLVSRSVAGPDGRPEAALLGQADWLTATRAGWGNPGELKRSSLQRFGWRLEGQNLVRIHWPATDRTEATPMFSEVVLNEVEGLEFLFHDWSRQRVERWPLNDELARLPRAVEVRLTTRRFGTVRRLVVLQ